MSLCLCDAPVVHERIGDGLADELAVLLQGVERVLHRLVDGFLDGATHLLDLVDTATRLRCHAERVQKKTVDLSIKELE